MARICIAEDDADIRSVLRQSLLEVGHDVSVSNDGQSALAAVVAEPPDVLVLDLMMPGLDGFDVLDGLLMHGVRNKTKVLILSARNSERERLEGLEHGADMYLTKPFDHEEFVDAVDQLVNSTPEELARKRESERDKALLLAQLETVFNEPGI